MKRALQIIHSHRITGALIKEHAGHLNHAAYVLWCLQL